MPQYIGYSPWQDAAQYGRSLGETLGQILLGVPQMRHQKRLQERQDQRAEASLGSQLALNEARIADIPAQRRRQDMYNTLQNRNAQNNATRQLLDLYKYNAEAELYGNPQLQFELDEFGAPVNIREAAMGSESMPEPPPVEEAGPGIMDRIGGWFSSGEAEEQGPSLDSLKALSERILTPAHQASPGLGQQIVNSSGQGRGLDVMEGRVNPVTEATPPTPENNVLVRDPRTGQKGWVTEAEASQYEVIRVFPRR